MNTQPILLRTRKMVEMFIRKAALIVFNARINTKEDKDNDNQLLINNTSFLLTQRDNDDIADIFSEDYNELFDLEKERKETLSNSYIMEIYIKRGEFKTMIEQWTFKYFYNQQKIEINKHNDVHYYKKLVVMLRSVYALTREMPGYRLYRDSITNSNNNKSNTNSNSNKKSKEEYTLGFRLFVKLTNQNRFECVNTAKVNIVNPTIMNLGLQLEYISLRDINEIEENYNRKRLDDLIEKNTLVMQRPRCLSLNVDPIAIANRNNYYHIYSFDIEGGGRRKRSSKGNDFNDYYGGSINYSTQGNIIKNNNIIADETDNDYEHEEVLEDILFQSEDEGENDNANKGIEIENTQSKYALDYNEQYEESNKSNKAIFQSLKSNSLVSDTMQGFKKMKAKAFKFKKANSEVKLMRTSESSSSFVSDDDSFELDFDQSGGGKSNVDEINIDTGSGLINNDDNKDMTINTDSILNKLNTLKNRIIKTKDKTKKSKPRIRIDVRKLAEIYLTVCNSRY